MIICIKEEKIEKYENMKEMFNELTKNGDIVSDVNDGDFVITDLEGNRILVDYFKPDIIGTKKELEKDVVEFRNSLRANLKSLIDSGINIPKEEKEKLAQKFEFIKEL